ncbi:MAG: SPOR domain-containing protein [Deltaproteobacteria bacterium]|nr:SPOR domain-containing protein [Candidatus Tharpella sp.]
MYCPECKLRIADDDVTICPVCQGPLQPEEGRAEIYNVAVDENGFAVPEGMSPETPVSEAGSASEVRVDDKFGAYKSSEQSNDFNLEELGLRSSEQRDPAVEEEDIRVLADLWQDEDVGADLEGVLAEAFSLEDVEKNVDLDFDGLDLNSIDLNENRTEGVGFEPEDKVVESIDVDAEIVNLNQVVEAEEIGSQDTQPEMTTPPPTITPPQNHRSLWLLLMFVVVAVGGGAYWYYLQNPVVKPAIQAVKPVPQSQSVKPVSPPLAKEQEQLAAEKVTTTKSLSGAVQKSQGDQDAAVMVRDSTVVEVVKDKESKSINLPRAAAELVSGSVVRPVLDEPEKLVSQKVESLPVANSATVKKTEISAVPSGDTGEQRLASVATPEPEVQKVVVDAIKPPKETALLASNPKIEVLARLPYAIHIGSFRSKKGASRQRAMLQKKGFAAYRVEVELKEKGVWQRVLVPGGNTLDEAKVVQRKLAEIFPQEESLIRKDRR